MQDSAFIADQFNQMQFKLALLHEGLQATGPIIDQLKEILSLQWALGNFFIIALFLIALKAYWFARKAVKAFNSEYKLPGRWLYSMIACLVIGIFLFNALPKWININVQDVEKAKQTADITP
jgi:hypothetical protein